MSRIIITILILVNCIYLINTAEEIDFPTKLSANLRANALSPRSIINRFVTWISNIINNIRERLSQIFGRRTTITPTSPTKTPTPTTPTTPTTTTPTPTTTSEPSPVDSICTNEFGEGVPCSETNVPYCWSKYICSDMVTSSPELSTVATFDSTTVATGGICMNENEDWLPCSEVSVPYCYRLHPCSTT